MIIEHSEQEATTASRAIVQVVILSSGPWSIRMGPLGLGEGGGVTVEVLVGTEMLEVDWFRRLKDQKEEFSQMSWSGWSG